jgi:predicted RNase H-like HicB family nuclease
MLREYLKATLQTARYEVMADGCYWGEVPPLPGVWAAADTPEACREHLAEAAEEWLLVSYWLHHPLPVLGGIDPNLNMAIEPDPDEPPGDDPEAAPPVIPGTVSGPQTPLHGPERR